MYLDSPLCRLPFAIRYNSKPDSLPDLSTLHADITANGLVGLIIKYTGDTLQSDTPEEYLKSLGEGLVLAAKLNKESWRDLTQGLYSGMQSGMIRQAEQKLESLYGNPPFLTADLRYYIDVLKRESSIVRPWISSEFAQFGTKAASLFREYIKHCGELFLAWPELWEKAKSIEKSPENLKNK
jgi:hypothetical protein